MIHAASLKLSPRRAFDLDVDRPVVAAVQRVAESRGIPMSQVALAWLLTKPVVSAPIVGATKPHYLSDAAAAVEVTLTEDEIRQLDEPAFLWLARGIDPVTAQVKSE